MNYNMINVVDGSGNRTSSIDKLAAHVSGILHEAFSIFIFNSKGEILLQQRAKEKYHSGGLWSNTVCSHPGVGEDLNHAVQRRLVEEMGFSVKTHEVFHFIYRSDYENGLIEYEFDHVFVGHYDHQISPNKEEVIDYKWISLCDLRRDLGRNPSAYTSWLKKILKSRQFEKLLIAEVKNV